MERKKFQGALNILSFNRHFYIIGLCFLSAIVFSHLLLGWPSLLFWLVMAAFLYGFIAPLIVSAYVYDFSGYYSFNWFKSLFPDNDRVSLIVNINAGFDETSFIIKQKFPRSDLKVFDFYNAKQHTEPAIKRARNAIPVYPGTQQIASDSIPMKDQSVDIIFLLSAAHEIRSNGERVQLLSECHRLCKPGGKVVMVEYLRDFPNFLAFSVGFTHFFSRSVWKSAFKRAGFSSFEETKFTAFMSIFSCSR